MQICLNFLSSFCENLLIKNFRCVSVGCEIKFRKLFSSVDRMTFTNIFRDIFKSLCSQKLYARAFKTTLTLSYPLVHA